MKIYEIDENGIMLVKRAAKVVADESLPTFRNEGYEYFEKILAEKLREKNGGMDEEVEGIMSNIIRNLKEEKSALGQEKRAIALCRLNDLRASFFSSGKSLTKPSLTSFTNEVNYVYMRNIMAVAEGYSLIINRGGTRSGKTYSNAQACCEWLESGLFYGKKIEKNMPDGSATAINEAVVLGTTLRGIEDGWLHDIRTIFTKKNIDFEGCLNRVKSTITYNARVIKYVHADVKRAKTISGGWLLVIEANQVPYDVYTQMFRTFKLTILEYNPDNPFSWVVDELENKNIEGKIIIDTTYVNNWFLDHEEKKKIEAWRETDIARWTAYGLGQYWAGNNAIYAKKIQTYKPKNVSDWIDKNGADYYYGGIDLGFTKDPTIVLYCAFKIVGDNLLDVCIEEIYRGLLNHEDSTASNIADVMISAGKIPEEMFFDPSGANAALGIKEALDSKGYPSNFWAAHKKNSITKKQMTKSETIKNIGYKIRHIYLCEGNYRLQTEFSMYQWKKVGDRVTDTAQEHDDHAPDAFMYSCFFLY